MNQSGIEIFGVMDRRTHDRLRVLSSSDKHKLLSVHFYRTLLLDWAPDDVDDRVVEFPDVAAFKIELRTTRNAWIHMSENRVA